jgi:hypothetical protein
MRGLMKLCCLGGVLVQSPDKRELKRVVSIGSSNTCYLITRVVSEHIDALREVGTFQHMSPPSPPPLCEHARPFSRAEA